jgi:hypothetical protein
VTGHQPGEVAVADQDGGLDCAGRSLERADGWLPTMPGAAAAILASDVIGAVVASRWKEINSI